jgi:dipeptidyl aminopeptidase/acylaminoacyl peptidase
MTEAQPRAPQRITIAGEIPAVIWHGIGPSPRPAVIYLPGGTETRWDVDTYTLQHVPAAGISLVSIDMALHGDRMPPGFAWRAPVAARDVFTSIEQTAHDLFTVVDYLRGEPSIDADRLVVRGMSHSGYIVTMAMGMGLPVKACLSIAGGGDIAAGLAFFLHRQSIPRSEIAAQLKELQPDLVRTNPLYHVDRFAPRPILMVHALHDIMADFSGHFALYQALIPYYRDQPDDCLFLAHADGHGHPGLVEELALTWIKRQLDRNDEVHSIPGAPPSDPPVENQ